MITQMDGIFEKYRLFKYLINNSDNVEYNYKLYCKEIESAVNGLPTIEKFLITERYLCNEGDYLTDLIVYSERFDPPISHVTYKNIHKSAFNKISQKFQGAI